MMSTNNPPSHDALRFLSDLLGLVAHAEEAKLVVADLLAASKQNRVEADRVVAEQQKLTDLRSEVEAGVAELRTQSADRIEQERAAFDKRNAAREVEFSAREKRTAELLAKAQADADAAAKMRATLAEKMKVLAS